MKIIDVILNKDELDVLENILALLVKQNVSLNKLSETYPQGKTVFKCVDVMQSEMIVMLSHIYKESINSLLKSNKKN